MGYQKLYGDLFPNIQNCFLFHDMAVNFQHMSSLTIEFFYVFQAFKNRIGNYYCHLKIEYTYRYMVLGPLPSIEKESNTYVAVYAITNTLRRNPQLPNYKCANCLF